MGVNMSNLKSPASRSTPKATGKAISFEGMPPEETSREEDSTSKD